MKRLLWAAPLAALALVGCDPKKPGPGPTPKTSADRAMQEVVATSPATDPSLPPAAAATAASQAAGATTVR